MGIKANQVCQIRIFAKNENTFRLQNRDVGTLKYIAAEQFKIGAAKDAEIGVTGSGIEPHHIAVTVKGHELWIENLGGPDATLVSGKAIPPGEPFPYRPGEVIQLGASDLVVTIDLFNRFIEPEEEAERLLTVAHRQIEEKTRKAIEESHAEAETVLRRFERQGQELLQQRESEGQHLIDRAKLTAQDLMASAKNEVNLLIKEAQTRAESLVQKGQESKGLALQEKEKLNSEISELASQRERLDRQAEESLATARQAQEKREIAIRQLAEAEGQYKNAQTLQLSMQEELRSLKAQAEDAKIQMQESEARAQDAENRGTELHTHQRELETQIHELGLEINSQEKELKKLGETKDHRNREIESLTQVYDAELAKLRTRVDAEYERQIQDQVVYFRDLRERENLIHGEMQKRFETIELKIKTSRTSDLHARLFSLVGDRAVLYGAPALRESAAFKEDLHKLVAHSLDEEFELRRRDITTTIAASHKLQRKERIRSQTSRVAGWLLFLLLLGFVAYTQTAGKSQRRMPASVAGSTNE